MLNLVLSVIASAALAPPQQPDTIPLYNDLGDHHHAIGTSVPMAQQYFDQGLRLNYAFNHAEPIASFQEALRRDPACAMCWWGVAHAYGPNINAPMDSASGVEAYNAARKAMALASETSPKEQAFIRAVATRYGVNPTEDRTKLDSAFARAMGEVHALYPQDDDAATLYADAIMNLSLGRYADAIRANQHAIHQDEKFIADRKPVGIYPLGYYPHNYAFLYFAGMMAGREDVAQQTAIALAAKTTPALLRMPGIAGGSQHYLEGPIFVQLRFERWADVLKAPAPPSDLTYANGLWRYARGVAYARSGAMARAETESRELNQLAAAPALKETYILGYNSGAAVLDIARHTLLGEIAATRKDWGAAVQHLRQAATLEDSLVYIEPPEWPIPVRHYLGRVLMVAGRAADAETAYKEDLERFPENVWSLEGLAASLDAQGKRSEAESVRARLTKARAGSGHGMHRDRAR